MANPTPLEFLQAFYPQGFSPGRLPLYSTTLRSGNEHTFWCTSLLEADRYAATYLHTRRVFFGIALHSHLHALSIARARRHRATIGTIQGNEASVTALSALWAVLPYRADNSEKLKLPDWQQALDLLDAVTESPSIVISCGDRSTGGGFWVYWLLDELWLFDLNEPNDPEKAAAKRLLRRVQGAIERRAAEHSWFFEATGGSGGLASAFPILSTPIGPSAKGDRAALRCFPLVSGTGRTSRLSFESLPDPPAADSQPWQAALADRPPAQPKKRHDLRPIAAGCAWIRHCRTDRATLDREQWQDVVSILARCQAPGADARELVHQVSRDHPGYDPYVTDDRILKELKAPTGPATCRRISRRPGVFDTHCIHCPSYGKIRGPIDLARLAEQPSAQASEEVTSNEDDTSTSPTEGNGDETGGDTAESALGSSAAKSANDRPRAALNPAVIGVSSNLDTHLLLGLEEVLQTIGDVGTTRQVLNAVAADRHRFATFEAVWQALHPGIPLDAPAAVTSLGYRLRTIKGRLHDGRILAEVRRSRDGVSWAVHRLQSTVPIYPQPREIASDAADSPDASGTLS